MRSTAQATAAPCRFSAEFRLVLLCLQWPHSQSLLARIAEATKEVHDWPRVEAIAGRHRVTGLVHKALTSLPEGAMEDTAAAAVLRRLRDLAAKQAQHCLRLTMESTRLQALFTAAGIQPVFLKGSALTKAMYGDLSLRSSKDIDIYVCPDQAPAAATVLLAAGYRPLHPQAAEHLPTWVRYGKAIDWQSVTSGAMLELHWKLTDLPLLRGAQPTRHLQQVQIAGSAHLPTLSGDLLLSYLCVHGASHAWGRLKWLADVYALLPQNNPAAIEEIYQRAVTHDAGRAVAQALQLCHDLFGLEIGRVARLAEDDAALAFLRWQVLRLLSGDGEVLEVDQQRFGTTLVYLTRFFLGSGAEAFASEAQTWTHRPQDVIAWRLPPSLLFLLPLKRVGQWISYRVRYRGRSHDC